MRIAAYCRVSTDKGEQLDSLEKQKEYFEEFAKKNNHTLVRMYADEGISGKQIKNRQEFLKMLKDAQSGLFELVVVKDISRFSRNTVDFLNSIRQLKSINIEVIFLSNNQSILGNSEFILTIFSALAQEESANLSKRVKFGKNITALKGRVPNMVYGYDKSDKYTLTINESEASVVRRIYDMYLNHGYGANKIAITLNKENLKTKRNARWSQNAVARILSNELYTGKVINKKSEVIDFISGSRKQNDKDEWIIVERPEFRIISDDDFANAQKLLSSRLEAFKIKRERHSNAHIFSTLIKCEHCGYSFRRFKTTYVNTYVRWICSGRNAKGADSCPNKVSIDESELLDSIKEYFKGLIQNKDKFIKDTLKEFNQKYRTKKQNELDVKNITREIDKLRKTKQKYMDMFTNEIISINELKDKTAEINRSIEKHEAQLQFANSYLSKAEQLDGILEHSINNIDNILSADSFDNSVLKRIIDKISVNADSKVTIRLRLLKELGIDNTIHISDVCT
jgi:DNA invertase Pin-like site-specific DNA recombinase